jgi:tryptophan synthase alpha chain
MATNLLDQTFESLRTSGRKALIAYVAAGYPPFEEQETLIDALKEGGVDVLELGIPFSDPIADGPTIQYASQEALKNAVSLRKILPFAARVAQRTKLPIVFMSYVNPILQYGVEKFARDARAAGVCGVIMPDMIPEEAGDIEKALAAENIHAIFLVAPTTPKARQALIAKRTHGFLYAVSVTGVTGARTSLPAETRSWLASLRKLGSSPVCVGFGISGPQQIKDLRDAADGFIVGSAIVDIIRKNNAGSRAPLLKQFAQSLSEECSRGR